MMSRHMMTANNSAKPRYPIPAIRPAPIARNSMVISLAVPGTERKRTRLKAPATATPVPTLPLTIIMTTHTTVGRRWYLLTKHHYTGKNRICLKIHKKFKFSTAICMVQNHVYCSLLLSGVLLKKELDCLQPE